MHSWTILGVVAIGLGTLLVAFGQLYFQRKWPPIVIGATLVAIGTALTLLGEGRASQIELRAEIERVVAKIDEAKAEQPSEAAGEKLDSIRDDFVAWATRFEKDRPRRKLQREQALLEQDTARIQSALPARELLDDALETLRGSLKAYASHSGRSIRVAIPPLPEDIEKEPWAGQVTFTPEISWTLEIFGMGSEHYSLYVIPLHPDAPTGSRLDQAFSISVDLTSKDKTEEKVIPSWSTHVSGEYFVPKDGLVKRGGIDNYTVPLASALQKLIELQILISDKRIN